jgi:hypothetical protein
MEKTTMNKEHGSPYDRGGADSYYDRIFAPHSLYDGEPNYDLTEQEIEEYRQGYLDNERDGSKKDYD